MENGVIRDRTPKRDIHEELEYTKGVIRVRTPKKDIHD
jgi:hypothetical protein